MHLSANNFTLFIVFLSTFSKFYVVDYLEDDAGTTLMSLLVPMKHF